MVSQGAHLRFLATLLAFAALITPALAHPHIFIDAKAQIIFDAEGKVSGIQHQWTFDKGFSVWVTQALDVNSDGQISSEELQDLANDNMQGLSEYEFYTFAGEGKDENLTFAAMNNQYMTYENEQVTLNYGVNLTAPYAIKDTLEIAINDPEYYVAITFADASAVTMENAPAGCGIVLQPPQELEPELADQLYALPPEVTELPPDLAAAIRGVQGSIDVKCTNGAAVAPATALDAVTQVAQAKPAPFGGPPQEPGLTLPRTGFFGWVQQQQKDFYLAMQTALGQLKTDNNAFWLLGSLAFLYGVFHAAGPGHGKVVISSYVLANERQVRRGIWLSFISAMLQSAVAVGFILVAALVLKLGREEMNAPIVWVERLSFALIVLLGLWLVARKLFGWGHSHTQAAKPGDLREKARAHLHGDGAPLANLALAGGPSGNVLTRQSHAAHDHGAHHDHDHDHAGHDHDEKHHHHHVVTPDQTSGGWREQLGVVLAVGMRPCSGALVILVFSYSLGVLPAGIAATFLMGLGTAITVGALASVAVYAKSLARRLGGVRSGLGSALIWWLELLGTVAVLAFGAVLLIASL